MGRCMHITKTGEPCRCGSVLCGYCTNHFHQKVKAGELIGEPLK